MNILITGGNGFLGSSLARRALDDKHNVYILSKNTSNIKDLTNKIKYSSAHTANFEDHADEIRDFAPDVVLHCGWSGGNSYSDVNSLTQFTDNIEPGIRFINFLSGLNKKPSFYGFGSFSEYGQRDCIINEHTVEEPINLYGASKLAYKLYSKLLCDLHGIHWSWIRPCYVYGPGDVQTRLIPLVINKLICNDALQLDKCDKVIDYLYVDDFVNFVFGLIYTKSTGVYNICSGKQYKLRDVIQLIVKLTDTDSKITFDTTSTRKYTSKHICGDNTKVIAATGHTPVVELECGIQNTINYYKANYEELSTSK